MRVIMKQKIKGMCLCIDEFKLLGSPSGTAGFLFLLCDDEKKIAASSPARAQAIPMSTIQKQKRNQYYITKKVGVNPTFFRDKETTEIQNDVKLAQQYIDIAT